MKRMRVQIPLESQFNINLSTHTIMTRQGNSASGSTVREQRFANEFPIEFLPIGNRNVDYNKVAQIKLSMQTYGITSGIVLIPTDIFTGQLRYYAVDGQHRYEAARALGMLDKLPVFFCPRKFESIQEIVLFVSTLNSTQTPWKLENYVNAYASILNTDYMFLQKIHQDYNMVYCVAAIICSGMHSASVSHTIKKGTFKVKNREYTLKIAGYIQDCVGIIGTSETVTISRFALAFYEWYNPATYKHKKFLVWVRANLASMKLLKGDGITALLNTCKL